MASLKDVAKLANVSLMTVSRALNSPERLKPETLARVQLAIEQTSYVPDLSAKKIRGAHASPKTIGVLALDTVTTPFSVEITLSIEETARMHGWNSFVMNMFTDDNPDAIVDLLLSHRPDGIIYTTMGLRQVPLPAKLLTLPCVLANCESDGEKVASYIPDDEQGQYTAVRALLAAGYRRLSACICLRGIWLQPDVVRGWSVHAVKRGSIRTAWSTAIWHSVMSTIVTFRPCCWRTCRMALPGSTRLSAVTIVSRLWCTRRYWDKGFVYRTTSRLSDMTIWWALGSYSFLLSRRYNCRTMKLVD